MGLRSFAVFLALAGMFPAGATEFVEIEIRRVPSGRPVWYPGGDLPVFGMYDLTRKAQKTSAGTRFARRFLFVDLLALAFRVNRHEISGPDWIYQRSYQIYFETREKVPDIRPVLRELLAQQFGVDAAVVSAEVPTLILEMPGGAPPLPASRSADCRQEQGGVDIKMLENRDGPMTLFRGCTMKDLAAALEARLHRRVIDATNCPGRYDFTLELGDNFRQTVYTPASVLWNKEIVEAAAKSIRLTLGGELREEARQTGPLVVKSARQLKGTVRIRK